MGIKLGIKLGISFKTPGKRSSGGSWPQGFLWDLMILRDPSQPEGFCGVVGGFLGVLGGFWESSSSCRAVHLPCSIPQAPEELERMGRSGRGFEVWL